ncbi:phosphonate ABC transporter ATP-binding protein [Wukongibacter baidiensis]|uniref:phosphonate ABC transporter ATP-binding protein n=1 Tax=Wukongibacter baidiensis TaxID=1723361 RepID=UPI003D7FF241
MYLQIKELYKSYHKNSGYVLENVNIDISKGERVVVLGLSGSGKSTLIRCVNRLIDITHGSILYCGNDITKLKGDSLRKYRRKFGMIFQSYNLINRLDVITNVLVGRFGYKSLMNVIRRNFSQDELEAAKEALKTVGLDDFLHRRIDKLSGGQQQRVGIARALVQQPEIILGDEPISSLDPITAVSIMELLKEINIQTNITMIVSLHNVDAAKKFATRIIGINGGKIIFDDIPDNLNDEILAKIYDTE